MINFVISVATNLLVLMEYIKLCKKNHANVISKPLCHIFNQNLLCNVLPHDWKLANVTPLFKNGLKIRLVVTDLSV